MLYVFGEQTVNFDGGYKYRYDTTNGIVQQESGIGGKSAQGSAGWYSPNGEAISFSYVADAFGYRPVGSHIPTPHPIPDYILKSIEQNRIAAELRSRQKQ